MVKDLLAQSTSQKPDTTIESIKTPSTNNEATKKPMLTIKKDLFTTAQSTKTTNTASSSQSRHSLAGLEGIKIPGDLPKSLSITPSTPPATKAKSIDLPLPSDSKKAKSAKRISYNPNPYARLSGVQQAEALQAVSKLGTSVTLTSDQSKKAAIPKPDYAAYADMLKRYPTMLKSFTAQFGAEAVSSIMARGNNAKKQTTTVQPVKKPLKPVGAPVSTITSKQNLPLYPNMSTPSSSGTSKFMQQQQAQRSPSLARSSPSSTKSFSPIGSATPPPNTSPTKTLQQKLAERKKANEERNNEANRKVCITRTDIG